MARIEEVRGKKPSAIATHS